MRALVDACVLYPTVLREVLLGVASRGHFVPLWSPRIEEEWVRTAARHAPGGEDIARGEIAGLVARFPGARVTPDPKVEAALWLPDPADVHVLAAAIAGQAKVIVTLNLRDFPRRELSGHGIEAMHPDAFLYALWLENPAEVEEAALAVQAEAERLSGARQPLRALLKRARLPRLGKALWG